MALLAKIPCILATTFALYVAHTPPSVAPSTKNKVPANTFGNKFLLVVQQNINSVKLPFLLIAGAEILVILSRALPESWPFPRAITRTLLENGAELRLGMDAIAMIGMLLVVAGGLLRLYCYQTLKKFFTFEVSIHADHQLVTWGPYSVVRHPSYSAVVMIYTGMVCWYGSPGSFLRESGVIGTVVGKAVLVAMSTVPAGITFGVLMRIPEEDKLLRDVFGQAWEEWAQRVQYSIIPGVY